MATFTLNRSDVFPVGTVVSVYPAGAAGASAARGQSVTSATVASTGAAAFTGLTADVPYVAHGAVGSGFGAVRFRISAFAGAALTPAQRTAARRTAIGTS